MSKVILIAGYGPGISHAVALKFGKEKGYAVALLSRTKSKLDTSVQELKGQGVAAAGYAVDLANTEQVVTTIQTVQRDLGEIGILFWNGGFISNTMLQISLEELQANLRINVDSLLFAAKAARKDLEKNKGAVLVTGGGLGDSTDEMAQLAVNWGSSILGLSKAAQRKLVHLLHFEFKPLGVFVGEVTVRNQVKGTTFDPEGKSSLTTEAVANAFVELLEKRDEPFASAQ